MMTHVFTYQCHLSQRKAYQTMFVMSSGMDGKRLENFQVILFPNTSLGTKP